MPVLNDNKEKLYVSPRGREEGHVHRNHGIAFSIVDNPKLKRDSKKFPLKVLLSFCFISFFAFRSFLSLFFFFLS